MNTCSWRKTLVNLAEATGFNGPKGTDMSDKPLSIEKKSVNAILRPCSDFPEVGKEVVINKPVKAGEIIMTSWGTWRSYEWVRRTVGVNLEIVGKIIYFFVLKRILTLLFFFFFLCF